MRAPFPGSAQRPRARRSAAVLLAAFTLAAAGGCAKRFALKPEELEKVKTQTEGSVDPLRVYTSERLVTVYVEGQANEQFEVDRQIREASARLRIKNVTTKTDSGLILKIEELNGMPLLWVTFSADCRDPACAFGFVQTEDNLYRLFKSPPLEGYTEPANFYKWFWKKKRRMKPGKMKSLGEANDILLNKKRNGKLRTIYLEVIKVVDDRTRTRTRRSGGVD
ncbi:hypothetical protein [Paraliomyxa miuraensis]|uniref:hypothetical protein n=1 Tax=Paraliomyxa miuraensis TaxID=376150 RepID=UPI002250FAB3|nr:hypothetical protein [Paraliomyxa miuraensis]